MYRTIVPDGRVRSVVPSALVVCCSVCHLFSTHGILILSPSANTHPARCVVSHSVVIVCFLTLSVCSFVCGVVFAAPLPLARTACLALRRTAGANHKETVATITTHKHTRTSRKKRSMISVCVASFPSSLLSSLRSCRFADHHCNGSAQWCQMNGAHATRHAMRQAHHTGTGRREKQQTTKQHRT